MFKNKTLAVFRNLFSRSNFEKKIDKIALDCSRKKKK